MLRRFFNWKNSPRHRSSNHLARRSHSRRQTLSRIATLAAESLEPRTVMAAFAYVDDSWALSYDVDQSGGLSNGDIVSSGTVAATYGSTAFGTVIGQTGVAGSQTIADAINNTDVGGTLRILEGSYTEDLAVTKDLSIVGDGASTTTLTGSTIGIGISGGSHVAIQGIGVTGAAVGIGVNGPLSTVAVTDSRVAGNLLGIAVFNGGGITALSGTDFEAGTGTANVVDLYLDPTAGAVTVGGDNKFGAAQFFVDNQTTQDLDLTAAGNTFEGLSNFDIEDKMHHVVDSDLALTNGLITWVAGNIYVTNPAEPGSTDSGIQRGIDAADAGFTVNVEAGTYAEAITLNKSITLSGAGNGDTASDTNIATSGTIVNIAASDVTVKNLRVTGGTRGIQVGAVSNTLLDTIAAVGVAGVGTGVELGGPATNVQILNSLLSANNVGLRMGTAASVDGLTITGSVISNNNQGIFIAANNPLTSSLKNVTVSDTEISNNLIKGAYIEKLQDATFTNITVTNNGTDTSYNFNAGFDINLKYGNYSNISFVDSTFTDNGVGATSTAFPGYGLAIKARNDGAYTANPASLTGVTLTNVTINAAAATPAAVTGLALGNNIDLDTVALTNVNLGGTDSVGLSVFGANSGDVLNLGDTDFAADLAGYIVNQSVGVVVDGTAATYGGVVGADATLGEAFTIVDKILDAVDVGVAAAGLVRIQNGQIFVTPNSFFAPLTTATSIQRGVDAASVGDTVHVAAGTYVDNVVNINKQITLSGANAGLSAKGQTNRDARGPETLLQASATGALMGINVTASDVVIDGLAFKGAGTTGSDETHIYVGAPNVTVRNIISNSDLSDPFELFPPGGPSARGIVLGANYDGFLLEQSFFARQRTGVFVNPGVGANNITFDNNEFASRTGINHDTGFTSLNSTITNNLFDKVDVDGYDYGPNTGVNVAVVPNGGSVTFTGNEIASNNIGIDLKDVQSGGTASFSNNVFSDHSGVLAVGIKANVTAGGSVTASGNTFNNDGSFIWNAGPGTGEVNAVGNSFKLASGVVTVDGVTSLADIYQIADKVIDAVDTGVGGLVRLQAGKVFVTPNSFVAPLTTPSIQRAIDAASAGDTVHVQAGTYLEDITVNKNVWLLGDDAATTVLVGVKDGSTNTVTIAANGAIVDSFTITREGNNADDWNNANGTLNDQGVLFTQMLTDATLQNSIVTGNRNGVYANRTQGIKILNNTITDNRTGIQLVNDVTGLMVQGNYITNNWTLGILFNFSSPGLETSSVTVTHNAIYGNWYGGIVRRWSDAAVLDVSQNWFGTTSPVVGTTDTAEPGYAAQIPASIPGGSAVNPGNAPDIVDVGGLTRLDYSPWLGSGDDADAMLPGFQAQLDRLFVDNQSPKVTPALGYIDEAIAAVAENGAVVIKAGEYDENVDASGKAVVLEVGEGAAYVTINGDLALDGNDTLRLDLGTFNSDQLEVTGNVQFGGATLDVNVLQPLSANSLLLLARRGGGSDTFGNLAQGEQLVVGGYTVTARYDLGDGNDFGFLTASNPVISDVTGPLTYVENAAPILLSPGANLSDLDNINFNGGSLQLVITSGGDGADRIAIRNEGTGTGQIGVSGNSITYEGVVIGTFTGGTGTTPLGITFTNDGTATLQAVQALLRNLTYESVSNSPLGPKDFAYVLQDGNGGVGAAVQQVNITPVADNPFVSPNGQANYTENGAPVVLAPFSYVTDADNTNFAGGALTVAITNNAQAADQLVIQNAGTGSGQIGVSGNNITFEGVLIGTFTGGTGTTPLVISLNSSATIAATSALIRSISFVTPGDNPVANYRTVTFQLDDGAGGISNVATKLVRVIAVNDAPTISMQLYRNYQAGTEAIVLAPNSPVTDPDTWIFSGGALTVSVGNADAGDRLGILSVGTGAGQISTSGSQVLYGGVVIGSFTGGTGSTPLVVSFNGSATRAGVQAVVRSITFSTTSGTAPRGLRNIDFVLTDGDGGTSPTATKPVYVVAPPPSATLASSAIGLTGGQTVNYTRGGTFATVLPKGAVQGNPAKGKLTISNASGQAADRLTIGGKFSVSQGVLLLNGIAVGTVNAGGGVGRSSLVISFNNKATQTLVQDLLHSIQFHSSAQATTASRILSFTLAAANGTKANTSSIIKMH
jgi:hypothetical protein